MPRFAANLSTLFRSSSWPERMRAVRALGFEAAEILFPYDASAESLRDALDTAGLALVLINTPAGDWQAGERGLAALPGRETDFAQTFRQALDYAIALEVPMIHVMAGVLPADSTRPACEAVFIDNLRAAAQEAADSGVQLLLEPLNAHDVPGYLHAEAAHTVRLIERIGRDNVRLQFDLFHQHFAGDSLEASLRAHHALIGHVQFSSVPGRHEPQYGEVDVNALFELLDALGYRGWVGCEYSPKTTLEDGLSWGRRYGLGADSLE